MNDKKQEKRAVDHSTGNVEVELLTSKHEHVTRVDVPPFIDMPEVIVWGGRSFKLIDGETDDYCARYAEVFSYTVIPEL